MKFKVYVDYTQEETPRPFYVGKGSAARVKYIPRNQLHESIMRKYGLDRRIEFETDDEQEAFAVETELIAKYHTLMNHEPGQWGANFTAGGDGNSGWVPSEETRRKIGVKSKNRKDTEETRLKKSRASTEQAARHRAEGYRLTDETKEKISAARRGKPPWNKGKKFGPRATKRVFSDEARENISRGRKGCKAWNKGLRGCYKHTDEARRKISIASRRKRKKD